jgi:hypothetical protein
VGRAIEGRPAFYGDTVELHDFDGRWVVSVDIQKPGHWVVMGCVTVTNFDGDPQWTSARLIRRFTHDVLFDVQPASQLAGGGSICFSFRARLRIGSMSKS